MDSSGNLRNAILLAAAYADIFEYPLTTEEIHRYLVGVPASRQAVAEALSQPVLLSQVGQYFTLPGREALVSTRLQRTQTAARLWRAAEFYGRIISQLPFVCMVAVTGSLAVNNVENDGDIDYLIVTAPGHMWLCRGLVLSLARLATLQHIRLCPNYMITTRALIFPDHNLYTAHEITQMIPLSGPEIYTEIRRQNAWVEGFLPNALGHPPAPIPVMRSKPVHALRRLTEHLMQSKTGRFLEQWEMKRKIIQLSREQAESAESGFTADYCKGHSLRHQEHTWLALRDRVQTLSWEFDR